MAQQHIIFHKLMPPTLSNTGFRVRRFLAFSVLLIVAAIILGFLALQEENWRGARDWTATKAKWEAKGVSFDPTTYFPPPIPDDQNLAALPLFRLEPDSRYGALLQPATLLKSLHLGGQTLRYDIPGFVFPSISGRPPGYLPDMTNVHATIFADYQKTFPGRQPPPETLVQFEALYPFVADLRFAATNRPLCRFNQNYSYGALILRPLLTLLTRQIEVSRVLTLDAVLALEDHHPEIALADMDVSWRLASAVEKDPSMVGGLVGIGMTSITRTVICNGLYLHAWNDRQLADIESELGRIDFLTTDQSVMRAEAVIWTTVNIDFLKAHRHFDYTGLFMRKKDTPASLNPWSYLLMGDGWLDKNKSNLVSTILSSTETVDPVNHLIHPPSADDLSRRAKASANSWFGYAPWNIFYTVSASPLLEATANFAKIQVLLDEDRIACALERYHLAHGVYPGSLNALGTLGDGLPHDPMNGDPYHYRLRPDGTFLLYSVGWNQTDDGGKIVYKKDAPNQADYRQGDWVWPRIE